MVNGDDFQIVFSDTPGIIEPNYMMQESDDEIGENCNGRC